MAKFYFRLRTVLRNFVNVLRIVIFATYKSQLWLSLLLSVADTANFCSTETAEVFYGIYKEVKECMSSGTY